MADEKKVLDEKNLEKVSGGNSGRWVTVTHDNGTFVALRNAPSGDDSTIVYKLHAGDMLYTEGNTTTGTAVGGGYCTYLCAEYNGFWGWIHSGFVR